MNKIIRTLAWPLLLIRKSYDNLLKKSNPEKLFCIYHKRVTGQHLDLSNPKSLNEKIAYMAFHTDTSEWTRLADKVGVRDYVRECGFADNLTKLYGVWENVEDIDFDALPQSFVIKTNNGSATNILIKDKSIIDVAVVKNKLNEWLKYDYGYHTAQPHYSRIKPLVLAEELLDDKKTTRLGKMLVDYKFYCVNGKPLYLQVMADRKPNTHDVRLQVYDMDWNPHPEFVSSGHELCTNTCHKPERFDEMYKMAQELSRPFPFVRVDLYEVNDKPVFGEMTFTPGFNLSTELFRSKIGELIVIE